MARKRNNDARADVFPLVSKRGDDFTAWMVVPLDDWDAYVRFEPQGGSPVIAELRILPRPASRSDEDWVERSLGYRGQMAPDTRPPSPPAGGLTVRQLRRLKLRPAIDGAREVLKKAMGGPSKTFLGEWSSGYDAEQVDRRPGRRGRPDREYARTAAAYVQALEEGAAKPNHRAAELIGEPSTDFVRDQVHEARRRGLLTPTQGGRAGGQLTEKAIEILERQEKS